VCRHRDGRLGVTRNPAGAAVTWWCETVKAGPLIRAARRHGGDIPAAACALGVALTDHATVLPRATAAVAKRSSPAWRGRKGRACCTSSIKNTAASGLKRKGEASGSWATRRRRRGCDAQSPRWQPIGTAPVAIVQEVFGDVAQSPFTAR
jgi:hypothetical protein